MQLMAYVGSMYKIISTSSGLYDPKIADTSWAPTEEFKNFLGKHFRRKLTFDQVCDILEEQAVPSVDALVAPVIDPSMLQHVAASNKKFIQERDRELANIQRAMLDAHCMINSNRGLPFSLKISN